MEMSRQQALTELNTLLTKLKGRSSGDKQEIDSLYRLYNYFTGRNQGGKGCGSCNSKVFQQITSLWYDSLQAEYNALNN